MKFKNFFKQQRSIIIVSLGMGILYLIRGSFLPYFFPIYEHLTKLNYAQISLVMSFFLIMQAIVSPIGGNLIDQFNSRSISLLSVIAFFSGFYILLDTPSFLFCIFSIILIGASLITLKNTLCVSIIDNSELINLRKVVSIRLTVMNVGSYIGNLVAIILIAWFGEREHIYFLLIMILLLGYLSLLPKRNKPKYSKINLMAAWKNKAFIAEAIMIFAIILPDGCWGTIIPKYIIDTYHSNFPLPLIYGVSVITMLLCSYALNSFLSTSLNKLGFKLTGYKWLALCLFLLGLLLFTFAINKIALIFAVFFIILGEIIITPCYDELSKKFSDSNIGAGSYYGILGFFDGFGRVVGAVIALFLYGYMQKEMMLPWYWGSVVCIFLCIIFFSYFISKYLAIICSPHRNDLTPL